VPKEGFYLGQVDWAGNSDELLVEKLSRFRDEREFLIANIRTGAIRRIFHESDPAWVIASYRRNAGLEWIRDGQAFIVLSEKDGWRHAYVYSRDGKELKLLTPGQYDIIERAVVDEARGWFYYYASPDNATQKYLYCVRLDGAGQPERVTPMNQPGTHDYDFSPDAKWAFHTYSRFDTPPITELVQLPGHRVVRVLEDNKELQEKMESLISQPTEFFALDIGGGVVMDAWMIKPRDFDPSRQYPVFVHVYGEPHGQTVLDAWGRSHADYHRVIADLGYLVVSIDNRGTPAPKGAAWRRAIFGSLGPLSTAEQAAGLKELGRRHPYVDLSRVGIWGWSGGGSNTLNAMFRKPDVYHVGIAVAPKPQPHLYNAWFQEIYMETPEVNPEGYQKSAPINFAEGLKGDLLIIHGTGETNTHLQITEGLVDRLIELGKQFDYMAYPNRDHGLREGQGTAMHLRMLMTRYLIQHLPPGPR
jgi:dipeptidyl-peptidase-4